MKEWVTVLRAADAAARWHVHQRRKGSAQEPYINHLLEVASLVAEATHGKDPDLVIAALLHDAIEDQEVPRELIEREFGKRVAEVVSQVTDDKTLPKENRGLRGIEWVIFEVKVREKRGLRRGSAFRGMGYLA